MSVAFDHFGFRVHHCFIPIIPYSHAKKQMWPGRMTPLFLLLFRHYPVRDRLTGGITPDCALWHVGQSSGEGDDTGYD